MSHWLRPLCCTRTGASHRRRGVVCQDASGWHCFQDRQGELVQLMAVADGHGGARYGRSDVGSWLACRTALNTARQLFQSQAIGAARPLPPWRAAAELSSPLLRQGQPLQEQPDQAQPDQEQPWLEPQGLEPEWLQQQWLQQQWLGQEFPRAIQRRWLQAVHRHWRRQRPAEGSEAFSPLLYGTTLGLVVMTPRWWGHTGLGDWDLLQLHASGSQLLSQESDPAAAGEATFSLCLNDAATHFASRTAIQRLDPEAPAFALVLSTDGIRKSCSTDDDFLSLGRYLSQAPLPVAGEPAVDLVASLDRISSQGSGDDVTVAIAHWLPQDEGSRLPLVSAEQGPAGPRLQPRRPRSLDPKRAIQVVAPVHATRVQPDDGQADTSTAAIAPSPPAPPSQQTPDPSRRLPVAIAALVAAVVIGGIGTVALTWHRFGPLGGAASPQSPAQQLPAEQVPAEQVPMSGQRLDAVRQRVRELCAGDGSIRSLLVQRRGSFTDLRWGWRHRQQLLAASDVDPLEALIALSYDPASGALSTAPEFVGLQTCPPLQRALAQMWLESQGSAAAARFR